MKDKKLYLNIIKGRPEVRPYKTKKCIFVFSWWKVIEKMGFRQELKKDFWQDHINDIYDYLIHGAGIVWVDAFGQDRLTDKGLALYYGK